MPSNTVTTMNETTAEDGAGSLAQRPSRTKKHVVTLAHEQAASPPKAPKKKKAVPKKTTSPSSASRARMHLNDSKLPNNALEKEAVPNVVGSNCARN